MPGGWPTLVGIATIFGVGTGGGGVVSAFPACTGRAGVSAFDLEPMRPAVSVGVPVGFHCRPVSWVRSVGVDGGGRCRWGGQVW